MTKVPKPIEWKDTSFPWCVAREYNLAVRNRCVFFHALGRRYRKNLNFALKFTAPCKIVVVSIYGKVKNVDTLLKQLDGVTMPVVLMQYPTEEEDIDRYDERAEILKRWKKACDTEESVREELERVYAAIDEGQITREEHLGFIEPRERDLEFMERTRDAEERIRASQRGECGVYTTVRGRLEFTEDPNGFLLELARELYPCGVEANAPDETGSKQVLVNRLIEDVLVTGGRRLVPKVCGEVTEAQTSFFTPDNAGALQMVDDISGFVWGRLERDGCCRMMELYEMIIRPPYGFLPNNYYHAILAMGLVDAAQAPGMRLIWESRRGSAITTAAMNGTDPRWWLKSPMGILYRECEAHERLCRALENIFELPPQEDLWMTLIRAISWVSEHCQTPLDAIDHRWYELLTMDADGVTDREFVGRMADWLDAEWREQKRKISKVDQLYFGKYDDEKLRLFYRFSYVKGGAVGWLHRKEDFEKRIEEYMKQDVCRECGRPLQWQGIRGYAYEAMRLSEDNKGFEKRRFTLKEIVGLNKKLLGRYQQEYYCIPCLCEILDTDDFDLWEKKEAWKEQGCELF